MHDRGTWYSFGDDGVTATVTASGELLTMTRYFPDANHKTAFCVGNSSVEDPFFVVERVQRLYDAEIVPSTLMYPLHDFTELHPSVVHHRWPHFTLTSEDGVKIERQLFTSGGTIYQSTKLDYNSRSERLLPTIAITSDLFIRDLDFFELRNEFNENELLDESYKTLVSDGGVFIRSHCITGTGSQVVLFVSAFSELGCAKFEMDEYGDFKIEWSEEEKRLFKDRGTFEVTIAYTLELMSGETLTTTCPSTPVSSDSAFKQLQQEVFEEQTFVEDPRLNRLLGLNLEYVLSVCSIPVSCADSEGIRGIAITCGDIDAHRIATSASFYSFQLLLLGYEHFNNQKSGCGCEKPRESCISYVCRMKARILHTCKGHLKWTFGLAKRSQGFFAPHYWINGEEFTNWENNEYLPGKALVDTPFQIIKVGEFKSLLGAGEISKEVKSSFKEVALAWIEDLDKCNKMGQYAFPRCRKEQSQQTDDFYFSDHVMIWRAIKAIEGLEINLSHDKAISQKKTGPDGIRAEQGTGEFKGYSSARLQPNILKRFTVENPLSRKRMIAVSRSPGQSRFLLRNRDAGLFHAMEQGFFDKPGAKRGQGIWENKVDVWKNTVDCQLYHEGNDDTSWDEPLRFALSFAMAQNEKQINARPVQEMRQHALSVLLEGCLLNGIFPGAMDENNEPILYTNEISRDTYWGITFEIPFILWRHFAERPGPILNATSHNQILQSPIEKSSSAPTAEFWKYLKEVLEQSTAENRTTYPFRHSMKHSFSFNNVVSQENIVELYDEWLYNQPLFFVPPREKPMILYEDPLEIPKNDGKLQSVGFMVDIPKSRHLKNRSDTRDICQHAYLDSKDICRLMDRGRSPDGAKKRLWAFFANDSSKSNIFGKASYCHATELSSFLQRHQNYDKYFLEETESVLNKWVTELHLSFYKIGEKKVLTNLTSNNTPHTGLLMLTDFDGGHFTQIVKVSASVWFDGDFFDRYWTCWFLVADPQLCLTSDSAKTILPGLLQGEPRNNNNGLQKSPWCQRRVLELLLFGWIVQQMRESADDILKRARSSIRNENGISADDSPDGLYEEVELDYNAFLATRRRFERFQKVLQIVQGDLAENLTRIDQWLAREKERQAERPRWTFSDESHYRSIISKQGFSNVHEVQELRRSYAKIVSFNDSIAKKLDIMRNDVDQHRADDIQRFTWVTIFFLPMGFATGVFSMNGAPGGRTLWQMIVTMVCALLVTVLLLMYSKSIEGLYNWISGLSRDLRTRASGFIALFMKKDVEPDPERGGSGATSDQTARKRYEASLDKRTIDMIGDPEWTMPPPSYVSS